MLKAFYKTEAEIPAELADYYKEVNGQWELQVEGGKSSKDVANLQEALRKERKLKDAAVAAVKDWTTAFEGQTPDEIQAELDRIPELEAKSGTVDEPKIEALVTARMKPILTKAERERDAAIKRATDAEAENGNLKGAEKSRVIKDALRGAAVASKVVETAVEDVLNYAASFEIDDDGKVLNKDGLDPAQWLLDLTDKRPHWWPASEGGGARGAAGERGAMGGKNPWTRAGWNLTEQGAYVKKHGQVKADQMAKAAGVTTPGRMPAK